MGYFRVSHAGYHWVNWPNLPFSTHFDHFANHFWYGCFMLLVLANPCIWWLVLFAGGFLFFNTIAKPPAFIWSIRMYIKDVLLVLRLYHLPSECLSQAHQDCWNSSIVFMPDKYYLLFIGGQKSLPGPRAGIAQTVSYGRVAPLLGGRHTKWQSKGENTGHSTPWAEIVQTVRKRPRKATWGQTFYIIWAGA